MQLKLNYAATAALLLGTACADAALNYSFTGNFTYDNDVQAFNFTVGAVSPNVILRTWSYAGGVNAAGQTIARGGFDPILAVFDSAGNRIGQNDDGGWDLVEPDPLSMFPWDTYLALPSLTPGTYTVTIMQWDNFSNGGLAEGFRRDGVDNRNFTQILEGQESGLFWDDSKTGIERDSHWAFDILNVEQAAIAPVPMPEPSTFIFGALLALPFAGQGIRRLQHSKRG